MRSRRSSQILAGVLASLTVVAAVPAAAQQRHHGGARADLFVVVPLDEYSTGVVFPFGGSHHQVPGVVAVNRAPYYCAPHARAFRERATFVGHLRARHGLSDTEIPQAVLVDRGQVRYLGD